MITISFKLLRRYTFDKYIVKMMSLGKKNPFGGCPKNQLQVAISIFAYARSWHVWDPGQSIFGK